MSDALDCLSSSKARFKFLDASISDNGYRNLNLNHVQKCMDVYIQLKSTPPLHKKTSASKNFLGIAVLTKVKDTHLEQNVSKLSLNDRWKNENRRKEFLCNLDDSDKAAEGERWHKKKESSVKKASTLSLHIAAYENAIEASDLNEENDLASTAKTTAKPVSSREGVQRRYANLASGYSCPFEFPRQQQNAESGAPEIMQFLPSQKLLSPNDSSASGSTSAPSTTGTPAASQIDQASDSPTIFAYASGRFFRKNNGSKDNVTFIFNDAAAFNGDGDLDPIALEWDGDVLFATFVDENAQDEVILGLKLSDNLEVLTSESYKGPYNQLRYLLDRSTNERVENPGAQDLYNFLISYRNVTQVDENSLDAGESGSTAVTSKRKNKLPKNLSSAQIEEHRIVAIKNKIVGMASSLPEPELMIIQVNSLLPDYCIRNVSQSGAKSICDDIENGTLKPETFLPLIVNKTNGQSFVFKGNKRLEAIKQFRAANLNDPKFESVKCNVYRDLDFTQKVLIANPSYQGPATTIQKLKLLREAMDILSISIPKGKVMEEAYEKITGTLFHNEYPSVLNELIQISSFYLDELIQTNCGVVPLEEIRLDDAFWKVFLGAFKKDPGAALAILPQLDTKTVKEVEKLMKKVEWDLLHYLNERGPHTHTTEKDAILYFTGNSNSTKAELIKIFTSIRIDHNKSREWGRYDWAGIKLKVAEFLRDDYVYHNATYMDKINIEMIDEQDFILIQNPIKTQLEVLQKYGKKAVVMLMGNYGEPAPEFANLKPTAIIKVVMENPLLIDEISTVLPDPVVNVSIYLPGAPTSDPEERTRYLCSTASKMKCSFASTMTLENCHEIVNFAQNKEKAALCFVSEKVAKHFLSKCSNFKIITVIGDSTLRDVVHSIMAPAPKRRKTTNDNTSPDIVEI